MGRDTRDETGLHGLRTEHVTADDLAHLYATDDGEVIDLDDEYAGAVT